MNFLNPTDIMNTRYRYSLAGLLAAFLFSGVHTSAQITLTMENLSYTEDFNHAYTTDSDNFSNLSWTDNATLPGWYLYQYAAGTPATVTTKASISSTSGGPIYLLSLAGC